ncbi:MAG TPA: DUF2254 domain-containing protein [Acidimicrobiales bacterium]|nr:DUF2254 domain-containing protein [Acidimicrobiales bacterium]
MAANVFSSPDHDVRAARLREWLSTGLWFLPMVWAFGAMVVALILVEIDQATGGDEPGWLVFGRGVDSARQVLGVIAGSTIAFTGTVFSITIVALQLASTQFSPRVLRTFLRDRASQHCFGIFVATALYSLMVLREVGSPEIDVPGLALTGAFAAVVASIFAFVFLVHHVANSIRAVSIMEAVAAETRASIRENFPLEEEDHFAGHPRPEGPPTQVLLLERGPGDLLGVDEDDLVAVAVRHDCVLELLATVGDYLPSNIPVVAVHGGDGTVTAAEVLRHVGIGPERTMYQDTAFGFRQLVDIAEKALSPAINDPTTAVQCIDRLHDLLRRLAVRPMPTGLWGDAQGELRLVVPRPTWDDYVHLAFDEIRHFGIASLQIPRRLRAALVDLKAAAAVERHGVLDRQLAALDAAVSREYGVPDERAMAAGADPQGLR